jgi:hypothetical protein
MKFLRNALFVLLGTGAALAAAVVPATATKGGSVTYTGTFTDIQYVGGQAQCPVSASGETVEGTWTVTTHGQTASAYFDITDHVAYPYPNMKLAYSAGGTQFVAYGQTGAGLLTVTLFSDGRFTYVIAPYNNTGLGLPGDTIICDSVTYVGESDD